MTTPNYKFIAELDDFLDHHGLSDTRAGLLAVRDGHVVSRIRSGLASDLRNAYAQEKSE